ncbi:MAG: T9SS type A sorting domain-containing protein [Ignavibacteria bacterium]
MKKVIYAISITVIAAVVIFCFKIAGGREENPSNLKAAEENQIKGFGTDGNEFNSYFPSSPYSPRSGGWQLQTMPNMGNRLVRDLYFTDSLTGYAVASPDIVTDSAHILKTTNGGNNWIIKGTYSGRLPSIIFINSNTGFAGGNYLLKTTNAGENWVVWNWPYGYNISDMQVFGEDTIWFASSLLIGGGAYRTTNGGINWEKRDSGIPANSYPFYIYFYNSRIGFATGNTDVYKTTDAGLSWNLAFTGGAQKLFFKDSLNGYRAMQGFFRTTNGGMNWSKDSVPSVNGNIYTRKWITDFFMVKRDTIYAVGASIQFLTNFIYKAIVYKTTNGGLNWGYQIPDTSFGSAWYDKIYSINNNVWAYTTYNNKGIYSITGGDSTIYLGVRNISNEVPAKYELFQNYPNPFNQSTIINLQTSITGHVFLKVFDITGKTVEILINEKLKPGTYEVRFDGGRLSSGIYFYQLQADNNIVKTRKMLMIK